MKKSILLLLILLSIGEISATNSFRNREVSRNLYYGDHSDNYLVRWEFQKFCHHVYDPRVLKNNFPTNPDEGVTFDPAKVKVGDIVFVRDPESFFTHLHPKIKVPYIIVAHGQSFDGCNAATLRHLDDKNVVAYFTIHTCAVTHPKLIPLPAGVVQNPDLYAKKDKMSRLFAELRESKKKHLLYCNFLDRTNDQRKDIKAIFENKRFCFSGKRAPFLRYIQEVAQSKFVLSPPGRAADTNRTWESLLVGSIPIVENSELNSLYENLPVLIINNWSEITEEFLHTKYEEITSKSYNLKKLYMEYWLEKIENVRTAFLKGFAKNNDPDKKYTASKQGSFSRPIKSEVKILLVASTFPKLSETFVINQMIGLLSKGYSVNVYARNQEEGKIHEDVVKHDLISQAYYGELPPDIETYDVIICQFGPLGNEFLKLKKERQLKAKLVTFFRGSDISRYPQQHPGCYDELFKEGDLFLTNCEFFRNRLLSLGAPSERTLIHYSAIDCGRFCYSDHTTHDDSLSIVTTGRLVPKKGLEDALYAMKEVIKWYPKAHFTIVGDGILKKKLELISKELNMSKHVTFTGWCTQAEVAKYLRDAQIFILPSATAPNLDQDAIPNVLKEAMASGLPVISTLHGGIPEAVIDGFNGYLVQEHDVEALAKKIMYLFEHQELGKRFGMNGRALVEDKFDIHKKADELDVIIQCLLRPEAWVDDEISTNQTLMHDTAEAWVGDEIKPDTNQKSMHDTPTIGTAVSKPNTQRTGWMRTGLFIGVTGLAAWLTWKYALPYLG